MDLETLFSLSGLTVLPFWALMIAAPKWRGTRTVVRSPLVLLAPALVYTGLVLPHLASILPAVARPSLMGIATLLGQPHGATVAWVHFLAFDLFVGRWIFSDAQLRGLSAWVTSPLLALTLLLGPIGLLAYLVYSNLSGRARLEHDAPPAAVVGTTSSAAAAAGAAVIRPSSPPRPPVRALIALACGSATLLVASLLLQLLDAREVLGVSTWAKPAKFGASVALNTLALAAIFTQLNPSRGLRRAGLLMVAMLTLELALIAMQAARAVPSHFNSTTAFDSAVFRMMGAGITVFWVAQVYVTLSAFRQRFASASLGWGIRFGLVATVLGGALGFLMPFPTVTQRATLAAGQPTPAIGAHAVGVPDGGPGIPMTQWSTSGGDLRVAHFVGLHGLQVLPLFGWAIGRRRRRRPGTEIIQDTGATDSASSSRLEPIHVVLFAGVAYLGLVLTTLIQALRAQPLFAPDGLTLALAAASFAAAIGAARVTVTWSRGRSGGFSDDKPRSPAPSGPNQAAALRARPPISRPASGLQRSST